MANDARPRGLVPLRLKPDAVHMYQASTAINIYLGAPVAIDSNGICVVAKATTDTAIGLLGVCVGVAIDRAAPVTPTSTAPYLKIADLTANNAYILVADDPQQEFVIEEDTGGTALGIDAGGAVGTLIYGASTGNTTSGWSTLELDRSTVTTGTAGIVQLLRPTSDTNSDGSVNTPGDYCKWVVKILVHQKVYGVPVPIV